MCEGTRLGQYLIRGDAGRGAQWGGPRAAAQQKDKTGLCSGNVILIMAQEHTLKFLLELTYLSLVNLLWVHFLKDVHYRHFHRFLLSFSFCSRLITSSYR